MAKIIISLVLIVNAGFIFGQKTKIINIDTAITTTLNLSDVAEKVTPVVLNVNEYISNIFLTNEYLFLSSMCSVVQCDLSGRIIRNIDCGDYVADNITCDTIAKKLYVPVGEKIKCFDFSGNLKEEYPVNARPLFCLYQNGVLWIQSYRIEDDRSAIYEIKKIDLSTGKLITLPFRRRDAPVSNRNGSLANVSNTCYLTTFDKSIIASFDADSILYQIKGNNVTHMVRWNIRPPASTLGMKKFHINGFVGKYLFINYSRISYDRKGDRTGDWHLYLEDMKSGKKYNTKGINDDVFHTGICTKPKPLYQNGCFYFLKNRDEFKEKSIGNIPLKNGPVLFIVQTKK
ncbi:MAG: hypothetical protein LBG28_09360 [Tannerella sp.]|nr:hypothetical protein [Tannerella sp.]